MSDELVKKLRVDGKSGCGIGAQWRRTSGKPIAVRCPIDGKILATIPSASKEDVQAAIDAAAKAFITWRTVPAPQRGELVRRFGQRLREKKSDLAALVQLEAGKITSEALGEVQEMIDVADFAVGLSRQLYGLTIATERAGHRMMEQWHPLGPIGVITAFNFPVAVWAWNAMLAFVCGDPVVWKPSEKTPLTAIACQQILQETITGMSNVPPEISSVLIGEAADVGVPIAASEKLPLISATGSTRMGKAVSEAVAKRLGRSLLELGGNNGLILAPSADLDLATRAIVFSAAGTAGQRCTTLRRLIVHKSVKQEIVRRVQAVYSKLKVGDPRQEGILIGPLIDEAAGQTMAKALSEAKSAGATITGGERVKDGVPGGVYVRPALVQIKADAPIVQEETFAPILYVIEYDKFEEAITIHNSVPQGLASAIFTTDMREAEAFLAAAGSDCGIANVNIGTSGAEIGGAFGGEKQTGGGRESGSDSWKAYMRRVTNTINYSRDLPLAQGVSFDV
jgi:aldehyde dehydrogenase (NAD+)